jgi:hypothetical protein
VDPAVLWRGGLPGPAPPEPWPGRHEAFLTACAAFAAEREGAAHNVQEMLVALIEAKSKGAGVPGWS